MNLNVEGQRLGTLGLMADGKGRFTKTHAHLIPLLREPFAIAMFSALRYQELTKLKEMGDAEDRELNRELRRFSGDEIVVADFGLRDVIKMVRQVAPLNSPIMLLGEAGVGKEVIANAIHTTSPRREPPFIRVNCGAMPEGLLDSELLGHERGAVTGAIARERGRFERADKGSIFLDRGKRTPVPR
jgi:transcriptional regulator with GAF, ATPase, and Fis domain